jgi:cell pole-organizing protein PopZ
MGDISTEPSMEEILSSIKRIIAEEGDAAVASRTRRGRAASTASPARAPRVEDEDPEDEAVLELHNQVEDEPAAAPSAPSAAPAQPARTEPILSERAVEATRGPLEALSRMVVKPDVAGSDTLEGLVREMLKPMLRDWLDANLPAIVETMVAREITRITGRN